MPLPFIAHGSRVLSVLFPLPSPFMLTPPLLLPPVWVSSPPPVQKRRDTRKSFPSVVCLTTAAKFSGPPAHAREFVLLLTYSHTHTRFDRPWEGSETSPPAGGGGGGFFPVRPSAWSQTNTPLSASPLDPRRPPPSSAPPQTAGCSLARPPCCVFYPVVLLQARLHSDMPIFFFIFFCISPSFFYALPRPLLAPAAARRESFDVQNNLFSPFFARCPSDEGLLPAPRAMMEEEGDVRVSRRSALLPSSLSTTSLCLRAIDSTFGDRLWLIILP